MPFYLILQEEGMVQMGRQYTPRAQYLRSCYWFILASLLPRFVRKPLGTPARDRQDLNKSTTVGK